MEVFECKLGIKYFIENGEPFYLLSDIAKLCNKPISIFGGRYQDKAVFKTFGRGRKSPFINRAGLKKLINEMKSSKIYPQLMEVYNCLVGGAVVKSSLFDEVIEVEVVEETPQPTLSNKDIITPPAGEIISKNTEKANENFEIFQNSEFGAVRVVVRDNEPWFVGKDVATILGYKNTRDALAKFVDDEDKKILTSQNATLENIPNRGLTIINESGLYSLILRSNLPQARKFKRWVTSEVLPSIRKHGGYLTPDKLEEALLNPDTMITLLQNLKKERAEKELEKQKRLQIEKQLNEAQPKIEFATAIEENRGVIDFGTFAKIIAKKFNIKEPFGRNTLFKILREKGYLMNNNVPYQRYITAGLFEVIEKPVKRDNYEGVSTKTLITGKGQLYLFKKLKEWLIVN